MVAILSWWHRWIILTALKTLLVAYCNRHTAGCLPYQDIAEQNPGPDLHSIFAAAPSEIRCTMLCRNTPNKLWK